MTNQERREIENIEFEKIMASHLPPRSEIHNKKKRNTEQLPSRRTKRKKSSVKNHVKQKPLTPEVEKPFEPVYNEESKEPLRRSKSIQDIKHRARYPLIKFLAFVFVLIPIIIAVIYFYKEFNPVERPFNGDDGSYEQVEFENKNKK